MRQIDHFGMLTDIKRPITWLQISSYTLQARLNFVYLWNKPVVNQQSCDHISTNVKMKHTHLCLPVQNRSWLIFMALATKQAKHSSSWPGRAGQCVALCMIHGLLLGADKPLRPGCRNRGCSCEQTSVRLWLRTTTLSMHDEEHDGLRCTGCHCAHVWLLGMCFCDEQWIFSIHVRSVWHEFSLMEYGFLYQDIEIQSFGKPIPNCMDNLTRLENLFFTDSANWLPNQDTSSHWWLI